MDRRGELAKAYAPRSGLGEKIGQFEPRGRVIGRLVLEHGEGAGPLARGAARDAALRGLACPRRGASHRRVQSYYRDIVMMLFFWEPDFEPEWVTFAKIGIFIQQNESILRIAGRFSGQSEW